MSNKLVSREMLALLAKKLDERMKAGDATEAAKIAKEIQDRIDAVKGVQDQLDALAGNGEGSVVDQIANALQAAKDYADGKDTADKTAQKLVDDAQDERIKALEDANKEGGAVAEAIKAVADDLAEFEEAQAEKDAAQDKAVSDEADRAKGEEARIEGLVTAEASRADAEEKRIVGLVEAEAEAARAAEEQLGKDIAAEAAKAREEEGKLAQAIKDEEDRAKGVEEDHEGRIAANEAFVAAQPAIDAEQDRRLGVIEASMGEGGALESRVKANEDKLAGLEEGCTTVQAAIDKAEADAKAHAEQKIADLVNGAPEAMDTLKELADEISANETVYEAYVAQHAKDMAQMKKDLQDEIDGDVAAEAGLREAADTKIREDFAAADTALHTTISAEIDADVKVVADELAKQMDPKQDGTLAKQINAVSSSVTELGNYVTGLETNLTKEKERAEEQEAAIRDEFADADDALHATVKDEMAAVIQSLAVGIVDGKLRIALGGIEGDDVLVIKEHKIDFVNSDDIDAIIASLDKKPEGQE